MSQITDLTQYRREKQSERIADKLMDDPGMAALVLPAMEHAASLGANVPCLEQVRKKVDEFFGGGDE